MRSSASSSEPVAALAGLRVDGITRGAFILRGTLAAAAVYGAGAATPFVRAALAQSDASDSAILDFALRLETLEANFYDKALEQVPDMSRRGRRGVQGGGDPQDPHAPTVHATNPPPGPSARPAP